MCVLLLPVIGLVGGMWLVPAAKPLWHRSLASPCKVLGIVEDGRTLLIVQTNKSGELLLIGLDAANGKERFTQVLTYQKLQSRPSAGYGNNRLPEPVLSNDGKLIALPASIDNTYDHVIVLYDWQAEKVVQRIELPTGRSVYQLSLCQGRLHGLGVGILADFELAEPQSSLVTKKLGSEQFRADGINQDASIVYWFTLNPAGGPTSTTLHFYDIAKQQALPVITIPAKCRMNVLDVPTPDTVLVLNTKTALPINHTVQTYRLQGDQYVHAPEMDHALQANGFTVWEKDYAAISELRRFNRSRTRFFEYFGPSITTFFDGVWAQHNLHFYDRKTMKHLLTHSADSLTNYTPQNFLLVPEHSALVLTYHDFLNYWHINSISRYLPLLGLLLGSLLSLLLIIRRYRVTRHRLAKASTLTPASSGD